MLSKNCLVKGALSGARRQYYVSIFADLNHDWNNRTPVSPALVLAMAMPLISGSTGSPTAFSWQHWKPSDLRLITLRFPPRFNSSPIQKGVRPSPLVAIIPSPQLFLESKTCISDTWVGDVENKSKKGMNMTPLHSRKRCPTAVPRTGRSFRTRL